MVGDALREPVKVVSGEGAVERLGQSVVAVGEGGETLCDLVQVVEITGRYDFALDDGKDDLGSYVDMFLADP